MEWSLRGSRHKEQVAVGEFPILKFQLQVASTVILKRTFAAGHRTPLTTMTGFGTEAVQKQRVQDPTATTMVKVCFQFLLHFTFKESTSLYFFWCFPIKFMQKLSKRGSPCI